MSNTFKTNIDNFLNNTNSNHNYTPEQAEQLNTQLKTIIEDLRSEMKQSGLSEIEIFNFKKRTGLDQLSNPDFSNKDFSQSPVLKDFIEQLKTLNHNYKDEVVNRNDNQVLEVQRLNDFLSYISNNVDKNDNTLNDYYKLLEVDKQKLAELKQIENIEIRKIELQNYFNNLALIQAQKNQTLFTDLSNKKNGFSEYTQQKDLEYLRKNEKYFTNETEQEKRDLAKYGRAYKETGKLGMKESLMLAKIAFRAAFPHTIITALVISAVKKTGVLDTIKTKIKDNITELRNSDTSKKGYFTKMALTGALAVATLSVAAMVAIENPQDAKEFIDCLKPENLGTTFKDSTAAIMAKLETMHTDIKNIDTDLKIARAEGMTQNLMFDYNNVDTPNTASPENIADLEKATLAATQFAEEAANLPPISAQEAAKAAFNNEFIGKPLPEGNIWKTGAMDVVKQANAGIDIDNVKVGQTINLPTFGTDPQGNRIITGFEAHTVKPGDTVSQMYVNHAQGIKPEITAPLAPEPVKEFIPIKGSLNLNLAEGTSTIIHDNGEIKTYTADEDKVIRFTDEGIQNTLHYQSKQHIAFTIIDNEGNVVETKNTTLGRAGFISNGVNAEGFKVSSVNSPDVLNKVINGEPITQEEYKQVQEHNREFNKNNDYGRRTGLRR